MTAIKEYTLTDDEIKELIADYIGEDKKAIQDIRFEFFKDQTTVYSNNPHGGGKFVEQEKESFNVIVRTFYKGRDE